jgi:hypothetical protein
MARQNQYDAALVSQRELVAGPNTRWFNEPTPPPPMPMEVVKSPPMLVEPAFHAQPGADEKSTPRSRAVGLVIRSIPLLLVWLVLSIGMVWLLAVEWPWIFIFWGLLSAVTWLLHDRREYEYSRGGVERHRADRAYQLKRLEMVQNHELRREMLRRYLDALEGYTHDGATSR